MEVPMLNTNRRLPQFDYLEGKLLLSAGMADSAAAKRYPERSSRSC